MPLVEHSAENLEEKAMEDLSANLFDKIRALMERKNCGWFKYICHQLPWERDLISTTAKVTGMFREAGISEVAEMLELNSSLLKKRVEEAIVLVYYHELEEAKRQRIAAYKNHLAVQSAVENLQLIASVNADVDWLLCH